MTPERFSSLKRLFYEIALVRGRTREDMVKNALDYLVNEGKLDGYDVSHDLDRNKRIDFYPFSGSKRYKIQVKSSPRGVEEALRKHPSDIKDKIFIVPDLGETPQDLADRIMSEIKAVEERFKQGD